MRAALLAFVAFAACAGARGGAGGSDEATFKVFYPDAPYRAKVGKKFYAKPVASCTYEGGRDARWSMTGARIDHGDLPPGFTMEDGAISGTPKAAGTWTVTVKFAGVTCAGKAHEPQLVDVTITAS